MGQSAMIAYRPDIDGLRALAILPVLFFHAGISPFSGGFVGVDVFFVISGYLITGMLVAQDKPSIGLLKTFWSRVGATHAPLVGSITAWLTRPPPCHAWRSSS